MSAPVLNGRRAHTIAIVEEEGKAFCVWFPDLPGCASAGDTLDEAMLNAEALELWTGAMIESGQKIPAASSLFRTANFLTKL